MGKAIRKSVFWDRGSGMLRVRKTNGGDFMETTYYNLDAKRLTVYDMASGESVPRPRSYTCIRRRSSRAKPGQVLDMEAYRRKLAGEEGGLSGETAGELEQAAAQPRAQRRLRRSALVMDFCATAAVVVMAVVVISQFIHIL